MRWVTFSQWEMAEADVGVRHIQKITFVSPNGDEVFSHQTDFVGEPKKIVHRVVVTSFGFPVVSEGVYRMKLWLQRDGESAWTEVSDYPLEITHNLQFPVQ